MLVSSVFVLFNQVKHGFPAFCDGFFDCHNCTYSKEPSNPVCGWCARPAVSGGSFCTAGNATGPTNGTKCSQWHHLHSQVYKTTTGYPVSPLISWVYLRINQNVSVPIQLLVPNTDDQALDIMLTYVRRKFDYQPQCLGSIVLYGRRFINILHDRNRYDC